MCFQSAGNKKSFRQFRYSELRNSTVRAKKRTLHALRDHLVSSPLHRNDVALLAHAEGVHRRLSVQLQSDRVTVARTNLGVSVQVVPAHDDAETLVQRHGAVWNSDDMNMNIVSEELLIR